MLKRFVALAAAALMLSACAMNGSVSNPGLSIAPDIATSVKKLGDFTLRDLGNANDIAVKAGDKQGMACYPVLIAFVTAQQNAAGGAAGNTVSGAFSAFEAARTAAKGGQTLISRATLTALQMGCGALITDTMNTPAQFMAALAGIGAP